MRGFWKRASPPTSVSRPPRQPRFKTFYMADRGNRGGAFRCQSQICMDEKAAGRFCGRSEDGERTWAGRDGKGNTSSLRDSEPSRDLHRTRPPVSDLASCVASSKTCFGAQTSRFAPLLDCPGRWNKRHGDPDHWPFSSASSSDYPSHPRGNQDFGFRSASHELVNLHRHQNQLIFPVSFLEPPPPVKASLDSPDVPIYVTGLRKGNVLGLDPTVSIVPSWIGAVWGSNSGAETPKSGTASVPTPTSAGGDRPKTTQVTFRNHPRTFFNFCS